MRLLLDTHVLLWALGGDEVVPPRFAALIGDRGNEPWFSVVNIWEIAIKRALGRADFRTEPDFVRDRLLDNGWHELELTAAHVVAVRQLPPIHRDPFDRVLVAQAAAERMTLLTADRNLARYPGDIVAA